MNLRSVVNGYKRRVSAPRAGRRLARTAQGLGRDTGALVDLALSFRHRNFFHPWPLKPIAVRPLQIPEEFAAAALYVAEQGVRRILEIGTASGGTLLVWSWIAGPSGTTVSLDLPEGQHAGPQPVGNEGYPAWRTRLYEEFVPPDHELRLIKGDSHSDEVRELVAALAADEPFDFLFIDGDHSYSGARLDFETYSRFVRPGGLVGFHDIVERGAHTGSEVDRLWNEIKMDRQHVEFVRDPDQGWGGIGILHL